MYLAKSFPPELFGQNCLPTDLDSGKLPTLKKLRADAVGHAERRYLIRLFAFHKGHITQSATTAGVSTRQIHKLMTKHDLRKEDFK